jgi:GntR family transcriptional regulator
MPEEVSTLSFQLDAKSGVPFYRQLIFQVEMAVADGRLGTGDKLPTVRSLAVDLKINPNTVAKAYSLMEAKGLVTTQQGTGTFVSDKKISLSDIEREKIITELVKNFASQAASYGISLSELIAGLKDME